jgi:kinesin family protein 2/24
MKLKPRTTAHNNEKKYPSRGTKIGSMRDAYDSKNTHKYRNKNLPSKRKISINKKKERNSKYESNPKHNPRSIQTQQRDPYEIPLPRNANKPKRMFQRKHPQPNSPPPLPTNLQNLTDQKRKEKEDFDFMKNTLKNESENGEEPEEYFNFQEKVEYILDLQEDIMNLHLSAIREDAQMLKKESEIISNARNNEADYEIDNYIKDTEEIVRKKLMLYKQISDKIKLAKKALVEEEEYSRKMKNLNYY